VLAITNVQALKGGAETAPTQQGAKAPTKACINLYASSQLGLQTSPSVQKVKLSTVGKQHGCHQPDCRPKKHNTLPGCVLLLEAAKGCRYLALTWAGDKLQPSSVHR
jgi:hypothetical protein